MNSKILTQEEEIKKQVGFYGEQTKVKQEEEKELVKVLNDYKKKYEEFSKAMKKSKETFKMYENEIKNMNNRIQELQKTKKTLTKGKKHNENKDDIVKSMITSWEIEKENYNKEKEELK